MGRRKIEMKFIENVDSRQVTFSKRKDGIFKKATELATMCAADIAIIIKSPGGNPYSFGSPDVGTVTTRFLNGEGETSATASSRDNNADISVLNRRYENLHRRMQAQMSKAHRLKMAAKARAEEKTLVSTPFEELRIEELLKVKAIYKEFKEDLKEHTQKLEVAEALLKLAEKPVSAEDLVL